MRNNRPIHVWGPGFVETGGIQHYSACLVRALVEMYPGRAVVVFSKNDEASPIQIPKGSVHCFGRLPARLRILWFALKGILWGWLDRPSMIVVTHPHFAKAARFAGAPMLVAAHGIEVWGCLRGSLLKSMQSAAGLLPVSEFTRRVLIREGGLAADRCVVVPDTFREHDFHPGPKSECLLQRYQLQANQPVLMTVGRLAASEAYKGQDQVIEALTVIRSAHPEVRYLIAGRGDDEPRLRALAKEHGQEEAVIFAGFVPEAELADHYRLCDAFVMPSTGEGFGIVYLEALASGRPCIAGDRDASPEALGDGRWGFVVNPREPNEIAAAVLKLIQRSNEKPWLHEPETLRREVIERYGFAAFKASLRRAIDQLLPPPI